MSLLVRSLEDGIVGANRFSCFVLFLMSLVGGIKVAIFLAYNLINTLVGMCLRGFLDWIVEVGRPTLTVGGTLPWAAVLD